MTENHNKKRNGYPPVNSVDLYGFVEDYNDMVDDINQKAAASKDPEFIDEPVESWGWVNDADNGRFKGKRGY